MHQRCNIVRQAQLPFLLMASCRLPTWLRDESFQFRKMWARVQKLFFAGGNFPFGDKMEGLEGSRGNWANIVKCCCHHSWVVSKFQVELTNKKLNNQEIWFDWIHNKNRSCYFNWSHAGHWKGLNIKKTDGICSFIKINVPSDGCWPKGQNPEIVNIIYVEFHI